MTPFASVPPAAGQEPVVSLRLLGTSDLRCDHVAVHVAAPAQRLLAYLALQRRPVRRRLLAAVLWPDADDQAGNSRLRSTLWRMPQPAGRRPVTMLDGRLQLSRHVVVDTHWAVDEATSPDLGVSQLSGDLLEDWDDEWVDAERERFRHIRLRLLEQLSDRARLCSHYALALEAALAATAVEPLRESAHRRVMEAHLAEQNPAEALRQYDLIRQLLRIELGLPPSLATRSVVAALLGRPLDLAM